MKIEPGASTTVRVPSRLLDIADLVSRIRRDIQEAQPTVSFIMVHNKTKTAQVTVSFEQGTMHVRIIDPDEDYRFKMSGENHEQKEEQNETQPTPETEPPAGTGE